jgi:hypothetical protein
MSRTKIIEVEAEQWGEADKRVHRYLDRAGDTAWCEVWFRRAKGRTFGYRAGNPKCVFPEHHPCVTKSELAALEKRSKKVKTTTKTTAGKKTPASNASTAKSSAATSSAKRVGTGATPTTSSTDTAAAPIASAGVSDDWLSQI